MTRTRKILAWSCASFVLLIAIVVLVLVFFDWNRIKPPLNAKVSEELHRPFAINGNLAVVWQREPDEGGWHLLDALHHILAPAQLAGADPAQHLGAELAVALPAAVADDECLDEPAEIRAGDRAEGAGRL